MELNNELLEALKEAKQGTTSAFVNYLQEKDHLDFLADIESLLALQRQECAEQGMIQLSDKNHPQKTFLCKDDDGERYIISVDKESILNAKLF